jgi:RNA polymerase sigma-70 factor (ECF subfamily)
VKPGNSEAEAERLLIERTRQGSPEALADLVQIHSSRIYNWSLRILKSREDAEDNTQNVLCKMYLNIKTFKGHSRLSTWLYRMTINEAMMEKRRSRPYPAEFGTSEADASGNCVQDIRDRRPDPEQQYVAKELLARALLGLQPSLAQLFVRHKGEGWTQRELADKMGVSVAALKARIFWARERMQGRLRRSY